MATYEAVLAVVDCNAYDAVTAYDDDTAFDAVANTLHVTYTLPVNTCVSSIVSPNCVEPDA